MFEDTTKVLYHKNCNDGLAAAGIFYKFNPNIEYIAYQHGDNFFIKNQVILILDLSLPKKQLNNLLKYNKIYIVDHHLPTEKIIDLIKIPNKIYYDVFKCGSMILWDILFPEEEAPLILSYINDRDLWLNEKDYHNEMADGLELEEKSVKNFSKLIYNCSADYFQLILERGIIIRKNTNKIVKQLESKSYIKKYNFENKMYNVIYCNSPILQNDLGNYLVNNNLVDFAAIYYYNGYKTIFSLRGKNKVNLCEIAQYYGGGGHFNAAGCSIDGIVLSL